jgi:hypothetical protein
MIKPLRSTNAVNREARIILKYLSVAVPGPQISKNRFGLHARAAHHPRAAHD